MKISELVNSFLDLLITAVVPALLSLGLLYFIWGLLKFLTSAGDATKRSEGIKIMINGVIALTIMLTTWGLVALLSSFVGSSIGIPQF